LETAKLYKKGQYLDFCSGARNDERSSIKTVNTKIQKKVRAGGVVLGDHTSKRLQSQVQTSSREG
jgi:hypothetical protein